MCPGKLGSVGKMPWKNLLLLLSWRILLNEFMRILIVEFGSFFEALRNARALALHCGYWGALGVEGSCGSLLLPPTQLKRG